jgi:hypothetical protein
MEGEGRRTKVAAAAVAKKRERRTLAMAWRSKEGKDTGEHTKSKGLTPSFIGEGVERGSQPLV